MSRYSRLLSGYCQKVPLELGQSAKWPPEFMDFDNVVNVKPLSSRLKVGFVATAVLLSSLGLASPAHAKTYKCSKGGSFKVSKGYFDGDIFRNSGYVSEGKSCKGTAKIPATVTRIEAEAFYRNKKLTNVTFAKGS